MFSNRQDAGRRLAAALKGHEFHDPLVLAIPRGGVVIGAALADALKAELDVVLSRKLRAPGRPEFALGAVSEDGSVYVNKNVENELGSIENYVEQERRYELAEIARRKRLIRAIRPQANIASRSVIVTDDGIATGATMIAGLQTIRAAAPRDLIVAVPVGAPDRLQEVHQWCDEIVCLLTPVDFWAIGQFYEDFSQIEDDEVAELLRSCANRPAATTA